MVTHGDAWQVRAPLCGAAPDSRAAALQQVLTSQVGTKAAALQQMLTSKVGTKAAPLQQVLTVLALLVRKHLRYWYTRTHADAAGGSSAEMAQMSLKYMWEEVWEQVRYGEGRRCGSR